MKDVVEWAESPQGFYVDRHWVDGGWVLKPGPIILADYHARLLRHIFSTDDQGRLPYDSTGWCEPAKSGKSAMAGLCAEYMALHCERNSMVVMASNKQNQAASIMFASVADSINANPYLPRVEPGKYEIGFANGNAIRAIPSSSRGEAGARFTLGLFDELAGYVYTDAERLWSEFKTDPTRAVSMKMAVGYGGYLESELWLGLLNRGLAGQPVQALDDIVNEDGSPCCWTNGRHFVFWSHACRQPWQTEAWKAGLRASLRASEYARMVETRFVAGLGNFIEPEAWRGLVDSELRPLAPGNKETAVYVGMDLALSPRGDDCALIGVYRAPGDRVAVAFHKVWKGGRARLRKLKLGQTVKPYLLQAAKDYNLAGVWFDVWQGQHLSDELRQAGLHCVEVPQTRSTRGPKDTALYELAADGRLVLYDHPELRGMADGANALELGNGLLFLKKASGRAKIDLLVALSNCANEVTRPVPKVTTGPNLYDAEPGAWAAASAGTWYPGWEADLSAHQRAGQKHTEPVSELHRKWAKRHYCEQCAREFDEHERASWEPTKYDQHVTRR